jgi:MFS family permease
MAETAVSSLSFGAVFVLIADLQDRIGFADWGLGAVAASSFLASFVAQVSVARYADRGHARLLLGAGLALAAAGMVGVALGGSLAALVVARAVMGFGDGMFLPAARRIVASSCPGREAERLGRLGSAEVGGFIAGPPVAALVAAVAGPRAPFLLFAVVVVALGPTLAAVAEPVDAGAGRPTGVLSVLLGTPGVLAGLAIGAGLYTTIGVFDALWSRFLVDLGASTGLVAVSLLVFGVPMVAGMPFGGRLADRVGPRRTGFAALLCGVPLIAAYGQIRLLWLLVVIAVVHAAIDSVTTPSGLGAVARASPPGLLAAGQGLYGAVCAVAGATASAGSAPLYGAAGAAWAWAATALAVTAIVVAGVLLGARRADRPPHPGDAPRPGRVGPLDAALAA